MVICYRKRKNILQILVHRSRVLEQQKPKNMTVDLKLGNWMEEF